MDADQQARLRGAVGRNAERYLRVFERIAAKGGWAPGWNTAAFLHSTAWFCYRRMYGWAVLNLLAPFITIAISLAVAVVLREYADLLVFFALVIYLLLVFVWVPVYADSLYYRSISKRLADPQATPRPPSAWTALGGLAFAVAWLPVIAVLAMPLHGHSPRAKVSEAILTASGMRTDITEFHQQHGRLPNVEEAARFRIEGDAVASKFVQSVIYDPQTQRIVITLRDPYPGKKIGLRAELRGAQLHSWTCGPIDLDPKYLPGSCRD